MSAEIRHIASHVCLAETRSIASLRYICRMKVVFLLFSILFSTLATAQEVPRTVNFSKDDYRAHNQNWSLAQTADGEIFVGNGAGLLRFDGAAWQLVPSPNKQILRAVAADARGRVYSGAFAEFGIWQKDKFGNRIFRPLSTDVSFDRVRKEEIWHILPTAKAIYFQSFSTIYKFDFQRVTVISPPGSIMFLQAVGERLILPIIEKGLFELADDGTLHFIEGSQFLANKVVATILPQDGGGFLVGTAKDGIFSFDGRNFKAWNAAAQPISTDFQLNKGLRLSNGNYVFGTILNGVFVLKPSGETVFHLNKENGLQNNTVISLLEDHAQNLWLGLDKGIDYVDLNAPLTFFQDRTGKLGAVYSAAVFNG